MCVYMRACVRECVRMEVSIVVVIVLVAVVTVILINRQERQIVNSISRVLFGC